MPIIALSPVVATARRLSLSYRTRRGAIEALRDVDMDIGTGEFVTLLGPSGCGKSTLLKIASGLLTPSSGEMRIGGESVRGPRPDIGIAFQKPTLLPWKTVLANVVMPAETLGQDLNQARVRGRELLSLMGLQAFAGNYPHELSGGMQQRVGLARALASDPAILLMDEAFSALDPIIRTEMQSELLRLQQVRRRTIVFISHDLDEAMRIGDRVAIMKDGQVVQVGTPEEILRAPADDYVRSFVRGVDAAAVFKAADIAREGLVVVAEQPTRGCRAALKMLEDRDRDYACVVGPDRRFHGVVSADSLHAALKGHQGPLGLQHALLPEVRTIAANHAVSDLFGHVAQVPYPVPVVDDQGVYAGTISKNTLLKFLDRGTD